MAYHIISSVLDFMGWLASFFIEITPDNRLTIELGALLLTMYIVIFLALTLVGWRMKSGK